MSPFHHPKKLKPKGKIDISELNAPPEKHEYETAKYFANRGYDITFIKPSDVKGTRTPDFEMDGKRWEVKSPIKFSKSSFADNLRKAARQSEHVIFDLRRLNENDELLYSKGLKKRKISRNIKTILIITRDGRLLTLKGFFGIIKP